MWKIERTLSLGKMCFSCILYDHSTLHGCLSLLKFRLGPRNFIRTDILSHDFSACVGGRLRPGLVLSSGAVQSRESRWVGREPGPAGSEAIPGSFPRPTCWGGGWPAPTGRLGTHPLSHSPQEGCRTSGASPPALLAKQGKRTERLCSHPEGHEF